MEGQGVLLSFEVRSRERCEQSTDPAKIMPPNAIENPVNQGEKSRGNTALSGYSTDPGSIDGDDSGRAVQNV